MSFWCHRLDRNTNEFFSRISALASKKRSNQKSCVRESKQNPPISGIKFPYFFDLTFFKRLGQKSLQKIRWFLGDLKTSKGHFKIDWPLNPITLHCSTAIFGCCPSVATYYFEQPLSHLKFDHIWHRLLNGTKRLF